MSAHLVSSIDTKDFGGKIVKIGDFNRDGLKIRIIDTGYRMVFYSLESFFCGKERMVLQDLVLE